MADWKNNGAQGLGMASDYYKRAVGLGEQLSKSGQQVDIAGHSLGGGLASATAMASGMPGWTFNAAGLNSGTVEKYGGSLLGSTENIQAYRVEGELLTKIQEVNLWEDFKTVKGHVPALIAKEELSAVMPNAAGIAHDLPGEREVLSIAMASIRRLTVLSNRKMKTSPLSGVAREIIDYWLDSALFNVYGSGVQAKYGFKTRQLLQWSAARSRACN